MTLHKETVRLTCTDACTDGVLVIPISLTQQNNANFKTKTKIKKPQSSKFHEAKEATNISDIS